MSWDNLTEEEREAMSDFTSDTNEAVQEMSSEYYDLADKITDSLTQYNERMYGDESEQTELSQ